MKDKKGIALIMAIGILALLAGIATSFALNMRLEYKAAINYYNGVKANYLAEAAIERAIYELKTHVQASAFDDLTEVWAADPGPAYTDDIDSEGTKIATSEILDEQRKVNVNTGNQALLENLFGELGMSATTVYNKINNNRPTDGYINIQELISIAGLTEGDPGDEYDTIKDYVTVSTYEDTSTTTRSPVNINTCDVKVLRAVLKGLDDGAGNSINAGEATNVADDIINGSTSSGGTDGRPFSSWSDFEVCLNGSVGDGLNTNEATLIMNNCNPNRVMELLTTRTTEFCFNSGGYYEITGTGNVLIGGVNVAQKQVKTIVKIYDIYSETTKAQFKQGTPVRVTWFDGCPINYTDLFGSELIPDGADTIPGSLKIGFWDDFDEDPAFSNIEWTGDTHSLGNIDGDEDDEMYSSSDRWPNFKLSNSAKWSWGNCTIRIQGQDLMWAPQWKETCWVQFHGASVLLAHGGGMEWGNIWYRDINGICTYSTDGSYQKWSFPSRLAKLPNSVYGDGGMSYSSGHTYTEVKTFNMTHSSGVGSATVYNASGDTTISYFVNPSSTLNLYAQGVRPAWDDLRIIPANGDYTSLTYVPTGSNVRWGTMAFTGTIQPGTTITISVNGPAVANGGSIGGLSTSIFYKVNFTSNLQNTPILEDIIITYLPSTEILSWSK